MQKKKKKILFLTRLYSPHIGGVEKHVEKISGILVKKNYDVTIVCEQHDDKLKLEEKKNDITILRIPISKSERNKKFKIWKWMFKNINIIRKFDIIHIHDVFYWILPIAPILDRKKVFITFHGYEGFPIKLSEKIQKKLAAKYCSGSMTVGEFINKWYGIASNAVIYGGVEKAKNSIPGSKNHNRILFFGRLHSQTGIDDYYKAFRLMRLKRPGFQLAVIGEGDWWKKMKGLEISPFKSNLDKEIERSRFVFVSRYLSMLESMVRKRLVIAVYNDEIKKDYLLLSPFSKYVEICGSPEEIRERIEYFLTNPKAEKEKIEKAYKWATKQGWLVVVKTYERIWLNI